MQTKLISLILLPVLIDVRTDRALCYCEVHFHYPADKTLFLNCPWIRTDSGQQLRGNKD